jgi:AraC-like DNA-binding protein
MVLPDLFLIPDIFMPTWSTDSLPAAERFPFWREVRAKNLFGVSVELEPSRQATFHGTFSAEPIANSTLVELHASPYSVRRTSADIGRAPGDSICIYQQVRGGAWFSTAKGAEFTVSAGAVATSHTDLTYATRPTTNEGFHLRILKIPFSTCLPFLRREADLSPQPLGGEQKLGGLLSSYFTAFLAQASQLAEPDTEAAVLALAQIALAIRGLVASHDEPMRAAVRTGRLTCARQLIAQNFHRTELSPAMIAAMLGISVRQLHLLFEPTGMSFARYVMSKRLAQACSLLGQFVQRPVSSIAFACGFESLATFYRAFRNAFGVSPTDYRQSVIDQT